MYLQLAMATATVLEIAAQVGKLFKRGMRMQNSSLAEYTKATRLSPIVLIDKRVLAADQKQLTALLQTLLSVYCGFYLSAINTAMDVGNVKVMKLMDQFSTDRSLLKSAINSEWDIKIGNEEIDDSLTYLPSYGLEGNGFSGTVSVNIGANPGDKPAVASTAPKSIVNAPKAGPVDNSKVIQTINDESNLAVGKILEVKLVSGDQQVSIPVTATLMPKSIDPEDLIDISRYTSVDKSMSGRYHAWKAGEIRFVKDYLFTLDLMEADRKAMMADKTGLLLAARSKQSKDALASLASGYGSPNAISTMIIISKQTATDLEVAIKGKLRDPHVRARFFNNNIAMMLVVVDLRMERFTVYQRGIAEFGEYTLDDIKRASKQPNSVDIDGILRAYSLGSAVQL